MYVEGGQGGIIKPRKLPWSLLFTLLSIQALLALGWLVSIASDPKNRRLLGMSPVRLGMAAGLLVSALLLAFLALRSRRAPGLLARLDGWVSGRYYPAWVLGSAGLAITCLAVAFVLRYRSGGAYLTTYQRLLPLLAFLFAACLEGLLWLALSRPARVETRFTGQAPLFRAAGVALALLLALWGVMVLTGVGLRPDVLPDGWGTPGVPVLEGQIWLAVSAAGVLLLLGLWAGQRRPGLWRAAAGGWRVDALLAALVWLAAAGIWLAQPVRAGYFLPEPRPPNYEYYPYSDAITSGLTAQEIGLGSGFNNGEIITRPLYVLGLAVLHALAGPDYLDVIRMQTLLLAFFPVILYLLGRLLHSRLAGLLVAALAILREVNAIAGTAYSGVSNSKLFMSDLPTALGVGLVALLAVLWLRQPRRWPLALAAGGVLGLVSLVRLQTLLLAPFLALIALLAALWSPRASGSASTRLALKTWLSGTLLVALGVALAVAPWLARNWRITGRAVFDQPVETYLLAGYYSYDGRVSYPRLPGEDDGAYSARMLGHVLDFVRSDPAYVANFIAGHTLNNVVDTLLVLPVRRDSIADLDEVFRLKNSFWLLWDGHVSTANALLVLFNLAVIALGLGSAWRKLGWAGLIPIFILLGYSLSGAISRNSGWRYILPADWTGYLYFSAGVIQLLVWLGLAFGACLPGLAQPLTSSAPAWAAPAWRTLVLAGGILLAGASLPLSETLVPRRYPELPRAELARRFLALDALHTADLPTAALERLIQQPDVVITRGQVIYPRFYRSREGEPGTGWKLYQRMKYSHLSFFLVGPAQETVVLPLSAPPGSFPNGSEAWLVGCRGTNWLEPYLVVLPEHGVVFQRDPAGPNFACGQSME